MRVKDYAQPIRPDIPSAPGSRPARLPRFLNRALRGGADGAAPDATPARNHGGPADDAACKAERGARSVTSNEHSRADATVEPKRAKPVPEARAAAPVPGKASQRSAGEVPDRIPAPVSRSASPEARDSQKNPVSAPSARPDCEPAEPACKIETVPQARGPEEGPLPGPVIEADRGPIRRRPDPSRPEGGEGKGAGRGPGKGGGGGGGVPPKFHKRVGPENYGLALKLGLRAVRRNFVMVMVLTCATNLLILAIPIYLFQISDRVLTSRSVDTLVMLTIVIVGAVILQAVFDAIRRFMLMRTAVEVAARLGAPILSAASAAALHGSGREYQTLGDLQQLRGFIVSGTLLSFLDVPFAPLFILAIFLIHPHLGMIVVSTALALLVITLINQKLTARPFAEANAAQSRANLHLESMARNSQIINALAMIPEAVRIWGRDTATSLTAQVHAQDRNIAASAISRAVRLLTQIAMLGWGAYLAIGGEITGGMVIAASIIAGRALAPIEGAIEGWSAYALSRAAYGRISALLTNSRLQFERLNLPRPEGRLDVERLLYVPGGTKQVVLNGISFSLSPGDTLAIIGNSGAGKTTLGKMLVGSILPTSGNVRLDLMDLRNWDPRQLGENIGYLPQDVQLFPGTIKDNIGRMRDDATDAQIYEAAALADVHEMIANLPQGYETVVAADGAPLSGGQKQRIALARAFFGEPRFVVLDEPNSNLDSAGDKALARAIQHAKKNRITVVVVTQKPSLLTAVDKIMLLGDGTIQMFGERMEVLKKLAGDKVARVPRAGSEGGT